MLLVESPRRKTFERERHIQVLLGFVPMGTDKSNTEQREKLICDKSQQNPQPIPWELWSWDGPTELSQTGAKGWAFILLYRLCGNRHLE